MEKRTRVVRKIAIGLVLLVLAALLTFIIKDVLAVRQPENSLPTLVVQYNGEPLPTMHVLRDSYSWRFLTRAVVGGVSQQEWLDVPFAPVLPDIPLQLQFSYKPNDVRVHISRELVPLGEHHYTPVQEIEGELGDPPGAGQYVLYGDEWMYTPLEGGPYIIRIWADWGFRGSVLYYIKLDVRA